jgi:hypothetical protein
MLAAIHAGLLRRVLLLARTDEGRRRRGIDVTAPA